LLRESGRYPLTGRGDINTYAVFAETARTIINARGRSGLVLPTGIATDATTAPFFGDLVRQSRLVSFLDFENEAYLLSHAVHHSVRFCLLTVCGGAARANLASFAFSTRYIQDLPARRFIMPPEEILLVNPNTGTTPVFRSRRDAEITIGIYKRVPVLWRDSPEENSWGLSFLRMFDMANDAGLFQTRNQLENARWTLTGNIFVSGRKRMLPLYEAKMIRHFDHRLGTYEGQTEAQANMGTLPRLTPQQQDDPDHVVMPRYWVQEFDSINEQKSKPDKPVYNLGTTSRLGARSWHRDWLIGWRNICRSTDERTLICGALPRAAVGHAYPLALSASGRIGCLYANLASFVLDYASRQKLAGTNMTYGFVNQLPVLPPAAYQIHPPWSLGSPLSAWIESRVLELTFATWDMHAFARDIGDDGPPFRWEEGRRTLIRAELDAAYFHLYGLKRDEVEHVMESFDALRRREEKSQNFGEFRTKRLILDRYDAMTKAIQTGMSYQTVLDPPPGHGPRHPAR